MPAGRRSHELGAPASQIGDHLDTGGGEAGRHRKQERAGAGDNRAAAGDDAVALEQRLNAARGHHSREIPPGNRQLAVVASGAEHDGIGQDRTWTDNGIRIVHGAEPQHVGSARTRGFDEPHRGLRQIADPPGGPKRVEFRAQPEEGPPVVVTPMLVPSGGLLPMTPVLAPGLPAGVDQHDGQAGARRGRRGGETRRPGADHDQL